MSSRLKTLFVLHLMLLMYSISDILSKYAGFAAFPSWQFFALYAGVIVILGLYALGWQQILARLPLTTAYSNRAVVVVWGIIWGVLFFGEAVTWQKIVGAALIITGVILFSRADSEDLEANAIAEDSAAEAIESALAESHEPNSPVPIGSHEPNSPVPIGSNANVSRETFSQDSDGAL